MEPFVNLIRQEKRLAGRKRNYSREANSYEVTSKTAGELLVEAHSVADALAAMAVARDARLVRVEACEVASRMRSEQPARDFLHRNSFRGWRMNTATETGRTLWLSRGRVYKEHEPIIDDIVMVETIRFSQAAPLELHLARVGLAGLVVKHQIDQEQIVQDINKRLDQYEGY